MLTIIQSYIYIATNNFNNLRKIKQNKICISCMASDLSLHKTKHTEDYYCPLLLPSPVCNTELTPIDILQSLFPERLKDGSHHQVKSYCPIVKRQYDLEYILVILKLQTICKTRSFKLQQNLQKFLHSSFNTMTFQHYHTLKELPIFNDVQEKKCKKIFGNKYEQMVIFFNYVIHLEIIKFLLKRLSTWVTLLFKLIYNTVM